MHAGCMRAARATHARTSTVSSRSGTPSLWSSLAESLALSAESTTVTVTEPRLRLTMENKQTTNPVVMSYRAQTSTLVVNRELLRNGQSAPDSRSARHIELELPAGMEYQTGDHLGVLPRNNVDLIRRVMARFGLDAGTYVTINPTGGGTYTHLPLGESAPLLGILGACVELQDVASRSDLAVLARYAQDRGGRAAADHVRPRRGRPRGPSRAGQLVGGRCSSCWTTSPSCDLPFNVYLELLPPMRPRYYSISSSPAVASSCHLTVGVLHGPAAAATGTSTALPPTTWRAAWRAAHSSPLFASRPSPSARRPIHIHR